MSDSDFAGFSSEEENRTGVQHIPSQKYGSMLGVGGYLYRLDKKVILNDFMPCDYYFTNFTILLVIDTKETLLGMLP